MGNRVSPPLVASISQQRTVTQYSWKWGAANGSVYKGTCCQVWRPELDSHTAGDKWLLNDVLCRPQRSYTHKVIFKKKWGKSQHGQHDWIPHKPHGHLSTQPLSQWQPILFTALLHIWSSPVRQLLIYPLRLPSTPGNKRHTLPRHTGQLGFTPATTDHKESVSKCVRGNFNELDPVSNSGTLGWPFLCSLQWPQHRHRPSYLNLLQCSQNSGVSHTQCLDSRLWFFFLLSFV